MRFIDGESVAERVAGVALLDAGVLSEKLLCDGLRGGAENSGPRPITRKVPAALDLTRKRLVCASEGLLGVMQNGPRYFMARLPGRSLMDGEGDLLVLKFGAMNPVC